MRWAAAALLPLTTAGLAAALPADTSVAGDGACGDAAADNFDPAGSGTPPGDNRACSYSCSKLLAHFGLSPSSGECWIDAGSGRRWPPAPVEPLARTEDLPARVYCFDNSHCCESGHCGDSGHYCINQDYCSSGNNTYTLPSWTATKAVVIQGHARGRWGQGATPLPSRVDAVGAGVTLVLRHVNMSGLVAVVHPSDDGFPGDADGGAVFVSKGALTVEHAAFRANSAAQVSPSATFAECHSS